MAIAHSTHIQLRSGLFRVSYHDTTEGTCVSVSYGDLKNLVPIVRLHSSCLFGESFHALDCDCADQLNSTLKLIKKNRSGAIVYQYAEGRGVGLANKIKALELQRTKNINTVEAFKLLGFNPDLRTYNAEIAALADLGIGRDIKVAGQAPMKVAALKTAGYNIVETIHPLVRITKHNIEELLVKRDVLGYPIQIERLRDGA